MRDRALLLLFCVGIFLAFSQPSRAQWVRTGGPEGGSIEALEASGKYLFALTRGGWFLLADNGANWTAVNLPLRGLELHHDGLMRDYGLVIDGAYLIAYTKRGIFLSTDNGRNWASIDSGLPMRAWPVDIKVIGTDLLAVTNRGVFLSKHNGSSWITVNSRFPNTDWMHFDEIGSNLFVTTERGCFRSPDNGVSWDMVKGLLESPHFVLSAANGPDLFALIWSISDEWHCLYRSKDNGASWHKLRIEEPEIGHEIYDVRIKQLAVMGENLIASDGGALFLSTDNGERWNQFLMEECGLEGASILCLKVIGENLFAGTWGGGVFLSTDYGASWRAINSGLTDLIIHDLEVVGADLFAGTHGSGVWRLSLTDILR